jgi:DNA-directed RNA polymerase subunit RPC12/RpoP
MKCYCARCKAEFTLDKLDHLSESETLYYSNCPECGYVGIYDVHQMELDQKGPR